MKHPSIRELFDYWNGLRGHRPAPERADIEPSSIRSVLADTFILAFNRQAGHPFRIAGTRACAAFGHELKGEAFVDLWSAESRQSVRDLLTVVACESLGAVIGARGTSADRRTLDFELLMLPLSHRGRTDVRMLGALAPTEVPLWFGMSAITHLTLGTMRYLGPETTPAEVPQTLPRISGRLRRGLMVYDGGQV
jgi:hypothetical protein